MKQVKEPQAPAIFKKYLSVFNALGNPTRQKIIFLLADQTERSVHEVAAQTTLSRPAVSHHLKILRQAKLVKVQKRGVRLYYSPQFETPYRMSQDFVHALDKVIKKKENINHEQDA